MTTQRITNHTSAPMSACLRAFVRAGQTGMAMSMRPDSRVQSSIGKNVGKTVVNGKAASNMGSNVCKRGNGYFTRYNSVPLRGSA
jgi:hypothetical protein